MVLMKLWNITKQTVNDGAYLKVTGDDVMASPDDHFIGSVSVELITPMGP